MLSFGILADDFDDEDEELQNERDATLSMLDLERGAQRGNWKNVNSYHMTQLFIGNDKSKRSSPIYTNFVAGQKHALPIKGLVYVPGHLLTAVCSPDPAQLPSENKYPHVTLMTSLSWTPKMSNTVLTTAMKSSPEFSAWYKAIQGGKTPSQRVAYFDNLKVTQPRKKPETHEVFGISFGEEETVTIKDCTTKEFY